MILHCMICSAGGTHTSSDSAIATIEKDKLDLPLTPEMFTSINPERHIPDPWRPGVNWQTMKCPRGNHLPWGIAHTDIDQAIRDGGPAQLLTDEGMIDIKPESIPQTQQIFTCEKCGREIKSKLAFSNHSKACKGKADA